MKNKLLISGLLLSISVLFSSCTNDDYEIPESKNNQFGVVPTYQLKTSLNEINNSKVKDSINETGAPEIDVMAENEGDPVIVIPPRKD
ncbi:hypothetical protein OIU83_09295 [Flavobacterium sp. LS1R49]|uniref:Uncharacterized protein n=1 Tax=Flavobacterium shii TaxID=2987687 RepID=A0A9X2ZFJ6_9FLAO|nr:hypothetical protein [Flavobacterium shii]MCV9927846.1 hypothetical protein [Flavobacterium shii]